MRYLLRKFGMLLLTLWAAVTLNFVLPRLMPGSPADAAIAKLQQTGTTITPELRRSVEAQLGVPHGSLLAQYGDYLNDVVHLQFGLSFAYYPQTVGGLVGRALPWTLVMVGLVTILAFVIGSLIGAAAAWRRGSWADTVPTLTGTFLSAFPYFWTALLLLFFLGYVLGWFPTSGAYGETGPNWSLSFLGDALKHAVLPAFTVLITSVGGWVVGMRNNMINTLGEDYVTFAEANGLHGRTVALRYAARNALLPNLTGFGMALGGVVGGSLLVEKVFGYPGVGQLLFNAVTNHDYPLMQALFLMITVSVLVANFLVDLLYGVLDPRTRR